MRAGKNSEGTQLTGLPLLRLIPVSAVGKVPAAALAHTRLTLQHTMVWHCSWGLNCSAGISAGPQADQTGITHSSDTGVLGLLLTPFSFHPPVKQTPPVTDWIVFPLPGSTFRTRKGLAASLVCPLPLPQGSDSTGNPYLKQSWSDQASQGVDRGVEKTCRTSEPLTFEKVPSGSRCTCRA